MSYSRRQTIEEKNNRRKAVGFVILSIGFILFMFFYGIPLLVKLANLAYDFKKGSQPIELNDTIAPPPPRLDSLPKSTNKDSVSIQGSSEAGSTVVVDINGNSNEVVSDSDGKFSLTGKLTTEENFIKAYAKDTSNNKSPETQTITVILDTKAPETTITYPQDKAQFYGSVQKNLIIKGSTEENVKVQINDHLAIVDSSGNFSFSVQLSNGDNNFTVKTTDPADNTTETSFSVHFTP